jgi:hypothetical protein
MDLPSGKEAQVTCTIMDAESRKKQGKKKAGRYYDAAYDDQHNLENGWIHSTDIKGLLV